MHTRTRAHIELHATPPHPSAGLGAHTLREQEDSDDEGGAEVEEDEDYDEGDMEVEIGTDGYVDVPDRIAGLSEAEQSIMSSFFGPSSERRNLNDLIMDKIREKEDAAATAGGGGGGGGSGGGGGDSGGGGGAIDASEYESDLPPKVVQVYTEIGKILKHYSAGKIPKAFKIIPSLTNWEEVLWLTRPDEWSPMSVFAATRIFASNLNERMSQRFFNLVLLERVKLDIEENGRLNYHLYMAVKKAVYKPAAFFKGMVLPMAQTGCSLKEATIMASVLAKVSIPANHSAVALLKLAEMPYAGPTSLFIRVLLNKKYALPHRVIDALVDHFCDLGDGPELPVLWHQSLLVFAQRYKADVSLEQKERLKTLFKAQFHHQITPEIRRELFSTASRAEAAAGTGTAMET